MRLCRLVISTGMVTGAILAQETNQSLSGTILNSVTGQPLARALVKISPGQHSTLTSPSGEFQFDHLRAGSYHLTAFKPQFAYSSIQLQVPLKESVTFKLVPYASIEGTVTDDSGEPLQGVRIQALTSKVMDGIREVSMSRSVATDDLGQYRLWNLQPGKYAIKAAGRSGGTRLFLGQSTPTFDSHECFTPVYSSGAQTFRTAVPLDIQNGMEARADFRLTLRPALKLQGKITNFQPYQVARFQLLMGGEDVAANRVALHAATGRFEIQDVVPGSYTIRVTQGEKETKKQADQPIVVPSTVEGGTLAGISLTLQPAHDITGHVRFAEAPKATVSIDQRLGCNVVIRETNPQPEINPESRTRFAFITAGQTEFTVADALPGTYSIDFTCSGAYVASETYGSQDLLASHVIHIAPGQTPADLEILIRNDAGNVQCSLPTSAAGQSILTVLIPQFPAASGAMANLSAEFANLAPGDYLAYAVKQDTDPEYRNPEVVRTWSGTPVHVDANGTAKVQIREVTQ